MEPNVITTVNGFPVIVTLRLRGRFGVLTDEYIVVCDRGVREHDRFVTWGFRPGHGAFWGFYTPSFNDALENAIHRYGYGCAILNPEDAPELTPVA